MEKQQNNQQDHALGHLGEIASSDAARLSALCALPIMALIVNAWSLAMPIRRGQDIHSMPVWSNRILLL